MTEGTNEAAVMRLRDAPPPAPCDQEALPELLAAVSQAITGTGGSALIYGSRVRGEARPNSDLDVALWVPEDTPSFSVEESVIKACAALKVHAEVVMGRYVTGDFLERISSYGIRLTDGEPVPRLPETWPPQPEKWDGDVPPNWVTTPLRHAADNLKSAQQEFLGAEALIKEIPVFKHVHVRQIKRVMFAYVRATYRVMALLGEKVSSEGPSDSKCSLAVLATATRPVFLWNAGENGMLRPALAPGLRGHLLSLADVTDNVNEMFYWEMHSLGGEALTASQAAMPVFHEAFVTWLTEMEAPREVLELMALSEIDDAD